MSTTSPPDPRKRKSVPRPSWPLRGVYALLGITPERIYSSGDRARVMSVFVGLLLSPAVSAALLFANAKFVFSVPARGALAAAAVLYVALVTIEHSIASKPSAPTFLRRLAVVAVRLLIVLQSAFLFGEFGAETFYAREIDTVVDSMRSDDATALAAQLREQASENEQIEAAQARQTAAEAATAEASVAFVNAQKHVDDLQALVDAEDKGQLGGRGAGCGPFCEAKLAELDGAEATRDELRTAYLDAEERQTAVEAEVAGTIVTLQGQVDQRVAEGTSRAATAAPSPAERFEALNRLTLGEGNWHRLPIRLAITLFLLGLESFQLQTKLASPSRHDVEVLEEEKADRAEVLTRLRRRSLAAESELAEEERKHRNERYVHKTLDRVGRLSLVVRYHRHRLARAHEREEFAKDLVVEANLRDLDRMERVLRALGEADERLGLRDAPEDHEVRNPTTTDDDDGPAAAAHV